MKVRCDHRSKFSNLSNWKEEAWKKSGLQRDSNPWPPRNQCDALPTELWSHTLGAGSIYWVHISREEWNDVKKIIWTNSYLNCGCRWKWRMIMAVNFPIEAIGKKKPEKSGLQRDSNPWPPRYRPRCDALPTELRSRDIGAMLYQLSYAVTHWERGQFIEFISPVRCCFQLLKLEN